LEGVGKLRTTTTRALDLFNGYYNVSIEYFLGMKVRVQLYVAGKVFYEEVIAKNYEDAKQTALARNPTAKVVSVTAVF
jgi:hypothetical protein